MAKFKKIPKRLERGHKNHQKWHIRASWGVPHDRPKIEKVNGRLKKKMISFGRPDKIEKYGPLGGTPRCVIFGDFCVKTRVFFWIFWNFGKKLEFLRIFLDFVHNLRKNSSFLAKFQKNSKKGSSFCMFLTISWRRWGFYRDEVSIEMTCVLEIFGIFGIFGISSSFW